MRKLILVTLLLPIQCLASPQPNVSKNLTDTTELTLCEKLILKPVNNPWALQEKLQYSHMCFYAPIDLGHFFISTGDE